MASPCGCWPLPILPQQKSSSEQSAATRVVYIPGRLLGNKEGQVAGHRRGEPQWMQFMLNLAIASGFVSALFSVRAVGGADLESRCQAETSSCRCRFWPLPGDNSVHPPNHRQSLSWQCTLSNTTCCRSPWGLHHFPHTSGDVTYVTRLGVSCLCSANCPCLEQPPHRLEMSLRHS